MVGTPLPVATRGDAARALVPGVAAVVVAGAAGFVGTPLETAPVLVAPGAVELTGGLLTLLDGSLSGIITVGVPVW